MLKTVSTFFILLFISAQALALVHMAEHQFEEHDHDGVVCEIWLYSQQVQSSDHNAELYVAPAQFEVAQVPAPLSALIKAHSSYTQVRAPPANN